VLQLVEAWTGFRLPDRYNRDAPINYFCCKDIKQPCCLGMLLLGLSFIRVPVRAAESDSGTAAAP
jgi:hypothetical protein